MKTMLIITGPQGSGNHVFSKIFALNKQVYGWKDLLNQYWIAHDHEPFSEYWKSPEKLKQFNWDISEYYFITLNFCQEGII